MQFLYPALTIGFALAAAPLLIHLINVLRHRRQPWGAMQFLLASYRRQRKWIWMRQLLLLLTRTAVIAILVAMFAGWISGGRFLDLFGGRVTHHVVILDDSFSMSDRSSGRSCYARALAALDGLYNRVLEAGGQNRMTLLRTSRADLVLRSGSQAGDRAAEFAGRTVLPGDQLLQQVMASEASDMGIGPAAALQLSAGLIEATAADRTIVYLMSDFRERDWEDPERIAEQLQKLASEGAQLKLVDCGENDTQNVSISTLRPIPDVWAAGVPIACEIELTNWGDEDLNQISISLEALRYGDQLLHPDPDRPFSATVQPLPEIVVDSLPAGGSASSRFQVFIAEPGVHAVRARIRDDAIAVDNERYCTLPLSAGHKVLIVDGDPEESSAYLLDTALSPGGAINTGFVVERRPPVFLQSASMSDLVEYQTIFLADLPAPDRPTVLALAQYVRGGGGLVIIAGDQLRYEAYNERFGFDDEGLLPGELGSPQQFGRRRLPGSGEVRLATDDPLTAPLRPAGDAIFSRVRIEQLIPLTPVRSGSRPATELITGPDQSALVTARPLGEGRVMVVGTGLTRDWSSWAADPSFVVLVLRAASVLGSSARGSTESSLAEPLVWEANENEVSRTARYFPPSSTSRIGIPLEGEAADQDLVFRVDPLAAAVEDDTPLEPLIRAGLAEVWLSPLDGSSRGIPAARSYPSQEGAVQRVTADFPSAVLPGIPVQMVRARSLEATDQDASLLNRAMLLLLVLVALLALEQVLAYWASYHPPAMAAPARPQGGTA